MGPAGLGQGGQMYQGQGGLVHGSPLPRAHHVHPCALVDALDHAQCESTVVCPVIGQGSVVRYVCCKHMCMYINVYIDLSGCEQQT